MTVQEFLQTTPIHQEHIAKVCGVHVSQVFRWKSGETQPQGGPLLHLVELSRGKIKAKDMPGPSKGQHFRRDATPAKRRNAK